MSTDSKPQEMQADDFFWQTYLDASKAEDEARPKNWEGSTTGILTFTGLFAATVAAFIVESYKLLSPDSGDRTNVLLEHMIIAMANVSSQNPVAAPPPEVFSVSSSSVVTNVFWFSSLLVALICALLSTLVQEWSRNYVQDINRRKVLHESLRERAFNHIYIRMGVNRYGMDQFVSWIVALVHLSVFLFACGALVFLFPINHIVAGVSTAVLTSFVVIYCVASLSPLLDKCCPYRTPVTYMMAFIYWLTLQLRFRSGHSQRARTFQGLITRQYSSVGSWKFLTDPRFRFAWERTYVHINSDNRSMFFRGLPSLIPLHASRKDLLSRMCADRDLMRGLFFFLYDSYQVIHKESLTSSTLGPEIFELVALLSERMHALEVEHYREHLERSVLTSSWLFRSIGLVSLVAEVDGPSQLLARLCLVRVRSSLLELSRRAFEKRMPAISEQKMSYFLRARAEFTIRSSNRNPNFILLLLTAGSYRVSDHGWVHKDASFLVPLHDDACCRDWRIALTPEGLAHIAACNALTEIAHVLGSSEVQILDAYSLHARYYGSSRDGDSIFHMPQNDRQKMPSSEFVSVLRSAGLDEWLEPGSNFYTEPHDGPKHDFLNGYPGRECVDILRELAQHVDFEAYFDRARMRNSNPLASTSIFPHNVVDASTHARAIPSQPSFGHAMEDGPQRSPDERDAFMTIEKPLYNPPSPPLQNGTPASAPVGPSHVANSLPAPETSSAVEVIYEDVRGTSREGLLTSATGESLPSSSNAAVTTPPAPNGYKHNRNLHPDVHEVKTSGVAAEAQHEERVTGAVEVTSMSDPLDVDEQEQQRVSPSESPGLRSVRVDDDRRSREGIVQDGVEMTVIASVRGSSSADVAE